MVIFPMATLDTGLGWHDGDPERILLALGIGLSRYTINEMIVGCNELGEIAEGQVHEVRNLLSEYDTAMNHQKNAGHEENAGKILVKADVLEWERENGGKYEAILREKARCVYELEKIFGFVSMIGMRDGRIGSVLYRS